MCFIFTDMLFAIFKARVLKKHNRKRREPGKPSAKSLTARAEGRVITSSRRDVSARLLDSGILLWCEEKDPFAIHLIVCSVYFCLCELGRDSGLGPALGKEFDWFDMTDSYDFMRHAKPGAINAQVDLPPEMSEWMLFDAINSFAKLFGSQTCPDEDIQAVVPSPSSASSKGRNGARIPSGRSPHRGRSASQSPRIFRQNPSTLSGWLQVANLGS